MEARKLFLLFAMCSAFISTQAIENTPSDEKLVIFDTRKLLIQAELLKPVFEQPELAEQGSYLSFIKDLLKLSIYYNDIVGLYRLDRNPKHREIIEEINEEFTSIQECSEILDQTRTQENNFQNLQQNQQAALTGMVVESMASNQEFMEQIQSRKRLKHIKDILITVSVVAGVTLFCLATYYAYRTIQSWFDEPMIQVNPATGEQTNVITDLSKKAEQMEEKVDEVAEKLDESKEQIEDAREHTVAGMKAVKSAGRMVRRIGRKYEKDVLTTKKHLVETQEQLVDAQREIEELKQQVAGMRALRIIDISHDRIVIDQWRKQKEEIETLEKEAEALKEQLRRTEDTALATGEVALKTQAEQRKMKRHVAQHHKRLLTITDSLRRVKSEVQDLTERTSNPATSPNSLTSPETSPERPPKKRRGFFRRNKQQ